MKSTRARSSNGMLWWRHLVETFFALLAICAGKSPVTDEFPTQGQWRGSLMFSLICVWINGWVNNREAGDLRRYRAHYDVIVMRIVVPLITVRATCPIIFKRTSHRDAGTIVVAILLRQRGLVITRSLFCKNVASYYLNFNFIFLS